MHGHKHILGNLLVGIDCEAEPVLEEAEVESDVVLLLLFPTDLGVRDVGWTVAGSESGRHYADSCTPGIGTDVGVSGLTPTQADLTVGENHAVLEESLVGETPGCCS